MFGTFIQNFCNLCKTVAIYLIVFSENKPMKIGFQKINESETKWGLN
jgi:hypothetical protein